MWNKNIHSNKSNLSPILDEVTKETKQNDKTQQRLIKGVGSPEMLAPASNEAYQNIIISS